MPSFNDVISRSWADSSCVQQVIDALKGTAGQGVPISITAVNDSANFALDARNQDTVNGRSFRVRDSSNAAQIQCDVNGVTINQPIELLYRFWRNLENLPQFMRHLESVEKITDTISHWRAKGPAGMTVEWDAEIYNEVANKLIAWRSLEGSDVVSAGSVNFDRAADGLATRVTVHLQYSPPMGKVGAAVARFFGADAETEIREDLHRFKTMDESGANA